jgi:serine/threonine protein phosphatase PrpC
MDVTCTSCGAPLAEGDRFCEACGAPAAAGPAPGDASLATTDGRCWSCGAPADAIGPDGYCSQCGMLQKAPYDRQEVDLQTAGAVSDQGLVHRRNEDAFALQVIDARRAAAVVCDGVSTASASNAAARVAADAALAVLADALEHPERAAEEAAGAAIAAAQEAVQRVQWTTRVDRVDPSCTLVCALCRDAEVTVGWVGDSRAYWLEDGKDLEQLTIDDSWAGEQVAAGTMTPEQAGKGPMAHAITNWVGPDAPPRPPGLVTRRPESPGRLILCSDGLWNYAQTTAELAALLGGIPAGASPVAVARSLTDFALERGGRDNITVAAIDHNPSGG